MFHTMWLSRGGVLAKRHSSWLTTILLSLELISLSLELSSYTQDIPSRFRKDVVAAAKDKATDDAITLKGLQRVLANIHMQDKLTAQEMEIIFREMGGTSGSIPADSIMKMI